jgi:hypothetical protein
MPFLASTNAVRLQSTKARCVYPTTASFPQRFDIFFVDRWPIGIAGKLRFSAENQPRSVLRFALTCQPRDDPSAFADKDRLAALMHLVNQRNTLRLKLGCVYLNLTSLRDQAYFAIKRKRALFLLVFFVTISKQQTALKRPAGTESVSHRGHGGHGEVKAKPFAA